MKFLLAVSILTASSLSAETVVPFTGGYSQSFNGLDTYVPNSPNNFPYLTRDELLPSGYPHDLSAYPFATRAMEGWYLYNPTATRLAYRVYGLVGVGSGYVNFGWANLDELGNLVGTHGPDRALGGISNGGTARPQFGVVLRNDTGAVIMEVPVSYSGEQWRGPGVAPGEPGEVVTLVFEYQVSSIPSINPGTPFIEPGGDFNFSSNLIGLIDGRTEGHVTGIGGILSGLNWAPGQHLILRWRNDIRGAGLAIDDFVIGTVTGEDRSWSFRQDSQMYSYNRDMWVQPEEHVWTYDLSDQEFKLLDEAAGQGGWVWLESFPYIYLVSADKWIYVASDVWATDDQGSPAFRFLTHR